MTIEDLQEKAGEALQDVMTAETDREIKYLFGYHSAITSVIYMIKNSDMDVRTVVRSSRRCAMAKYDNAFFMGSYQAYSELLLEELPAKQSFSGTSE